MLKVRSNVCVWSVWYAGFYIILGVLENGAEDFQDGEEVYEAIGEVLQEISNEKSEDDIRYVQFITHNKFTTCKYITIYLM